MLPTTRLVNLNSSTSATRSPLWDKWPFQSISTNKVRSTYSSVNYLAITRNKHARLFKICLRIVILRLFSFLLTVIRNCDRVVNYQYVDLIFHWSDSKARILFPCLQQVLGHSVTCSTMKFITFQQSYAMTDYGLKDHFLIRGKARMCFRRVRKIAKSDYHLRHVCPSVRLSAWSNSALNTRIFVKLNI
jgi:hypothetical protein